GGHVIGVGRALVRAPVAGVAVGRRACVAVLVATGARSGGVRAGEREPSRRMVEAARAAPRDRGVTLLALRGEAGLLVIRVARAEIVVAVAGVAVGARSGVAVAMTGGARDGEMRAGERERP